jgi:hypothetical protein
LPSAQFPIPRDASDVTREFQTEPTLELGRTGFELFPVNVEALFLKGEYDDVTFAMHGQGYELAEDVTYFGKVRCKA